ncbi:MAG: hypothetical protein WEB79_08485 [Thermoleophilaceae bacterium]
MASRRREKHEFHASGATVITYVAGRVAGEPAAELFHLADADVRFKAYAAAGEAGASRVVEGTPADPDAVVIVVPHDGAPDDGLRDRLMDALAAALRGGDA